MHALHGQTAKPLPPCAYATPPSAVVRLPTSAGACACATAQAVNGEMLLLDALTPCGGHLACELDAPSDRRARGRWHRRRQPSRMPERASLLATFGSRVATLYDIPRARRTTATRRRAAKCDRGARPRPTRPACARLTALLEHARVRDGALPLESGGRTLSTACSRRERGRPGTGVLLRAAGTPISLSAGRHLGRAQAAAIIRDAWLRRCTAEPI